MIDSLFDDISQEDLIAAQAAINKDIQNFLIADTSALRRERLAKGTAKLNRNAGMSHDEIREDLLECGFSIKEAQNAIDQLNKINE